MNFIFPFSWECRHPNWLSLHHFSEGLKPNHQPDSIRYLLEDPTNVVTSTGWRFMKCPCCDMADESASILNICVMMLFEYNKTMTYIYIYVKSLYISVHIINIHIYILHNLSNHLTYWIFHMLWNNTNNMILAQESLFLGETSQEHSRFGATSFPSFLILKPS